MDSFGLGSVLKILGDFGTVGLVIFLWWSDNKRIMAVVDQHKTEMGVVLAAYQKDMMEQREMYKSNVSLCKAFSSIAADLRDIVTLNIQAMTEVKEGINQNQFCPLVRLDQKKFSRLVDQVRKVNSQEDQ